MHALLLLQNSQLVMAASSGFVSLFERFGITTINIDGPGLVHESGAIYMTRALEKPLVRGFLRRVRSCRCRNGRSRAEHYRPKGLIFAACQSAHAATE